MPRLPWPLFPALGLIVTSCVAGLDIPSGTAIACTGQDECPGELHCVEAFGRCVKSGDATAPTLIDAASPNPENIVLVFDEALDHATAELTDAYVFDPPLEVRSATPSDDGLTVRLLTVPQIGGYVYTAKAVVYDAAGNPVDNTKQFTACCGLADTLAPNVLTPFTGQRFLGVSAVVSWSARRGAHNYTIRASVDEDFHAPAVSTTVDASVTNVSLTVPTADSYYLEVIADVTIGDRPHTRVALLGDTVRVYCASTEDCHAPSFAKAGGTIHDPFRSVRLAAGTLVTLGASELEIAGRGELAYDEPLVMAGTPFNVRGGYAPDFDATTRDPSAHVTTLNDSSLTHRFSDLTKSALIDGIRFTNTLSSAPSLGPVANVIRIDRSSDALVFDHCTVEGAIAENSNAENTAFFVTSSVGSGPLIRNSTITMKSDVTTGLVAFKFGGGAAVFDTCRIALRSQSSSSADNEALVLRNSTLTHDVIDQNGIPGISMLNGLIENNTIIVRGNTFAVFVQGDDAIVRNNFILVNDGTGIRAQESRGAPLIAHNTVLVARGTGQPLSISTHARLIDNVAACAVTSGTYGTAVGSGADRPTSYDANAVIGCGNVFVGVSDPNTLNGSSCGTGCTSRYRGNPPKLTDFASVFVDYDGPDNDVTTLEDNDLHLGGGSGAAALRAAGRSTAGGDCGSVEAPTSCGSVTTDIDGDARTPAESIGADQ